MTQYGDDVDGHDEVGAQRMNDTLADDSGSASVPQGNGEDVYVEVVALGPAGEVTPSDAPLSGREQSAPEGDAAGDDDINEQLARIEETRSEMSDTIDAIQQRLSPDTIKDQATEAVREAAVGQAERIVSEAGQRAGDAASGVMALITGNPVRSASIGMTAVAAATLLVVRAQLGDDEREGPSPAPPQPADRFRSLAGRVGERATMQARTAVPWDQVGEIVEDVQQLGEIVEDVQQFIADNRATLGAAIAGFGLTAAGRVLDMRREPPASAAMSVSGMMRSRWIIAATLPVVAASVWGVRQMMGTGSKTEADLVLAWLNDAYSMENALIVTLQNHAKDAKNYPHIQAKLEQHLEQTRRHAQMVKSCIERLGGSTNSVKTALGLVFGKVQGLTTGAAQDEVVKDALADYAAENFEVASYTALIAAAEEIGDSETASVCRQIRQEDQDMAHWLEQNLPAAVQDTMKRMTADSQ